MNAPVHIIAPDSASYPVHGAAIASDISYALALAWIDAETYAEAQGVAVTIINDHGVTAWARFTALIYEAWQRKRVRIRRFKSGWGR